MIRDNKSNILVEPAIQTLIQLALKGMVDSQFVLGECFSNGWGVKADADVAYEWLKAASDRGHEDAKVKMEELLGRLSSNYLMILHVSVIILLPFRSCVCKCEEGHSL